MRFGFLLFSQESPNESRWVHQSLKYIGLPVKISLIHVESMFYSRRVQMSPDEIMKYISFSHVSPKESIWVHVSLKDIGLPVKNKLIQVLIWNNSQESIWVLMRFWNIYSRMDSSGLNESNWVIIVVNWFNSRRVHVSPYEILGLFYSPKRVHRSPYESMWV